MLNYRAGRDVVHAQSEAKFSDDLSETLVLSRDFRQNRRFTFFVRFQIFQRSCCFLNCANKLARYSSCFNRLGPRQISLIWIVESYTGMFRQAGGT